MPNFVNLNNKYVNFKDAKIHIEDRGFQFSDSVYEVLKVINKKLIDFDFHFKRLKYSSSELNFSLKNGCFENLNWKVGTPLVRRRCL